jgi:hypothetical protein
VDERGLCEVEASCYVAGHAEIGVLVYGAGNHAGDCVCLGFVFAEDVWEGRCEGGGALNSSKMDFANAGTNPISNLSGEKSCFLTYR